MRTSSCLSCLFALGLALVSVSCSSNLARPATTPPPPLAAPAPVDDPEIERQLAEGDRLYRAGALAEARQVFERAVAAVEAGGDARQRARAYVGLGQGMDPATEGATMRARFTQALAALGPGEGGERAVVEAHLAYLDGVELQLANRFADSGEPLGRARSTLEALAPSVLLCRVHLALGHRASVLEDHPEAIDRYGSGVELGEGLRNPRCHGYALARLGEELSKVGRSDEALRRLSTSLEVVRSMEDPRSLASALRAIANLYGDRGDYARGYLFARQLLDVRFGDPADEIAALGTVGAVLFSQGHELAGNYFQQAYDRAKALGNPRYLGPAAMNLAIAFGRRREDERARALLDEAIRLAATAGMSRLLVKARLSLGEVHHLMGRDGEAREQIELALGTARSLALPVETGEGLEALADLDLEAGRSEQALAGADAAAALALEARQPESYWRSRTIAGTAALAMGRRREARAAFEEAAAEVERLRGQAAGGDLARREFFAFRWQPHRALVDLEARDGDPLAALARSEQLRARTLFEIVRSQLGAATAAGTGGTGSEREAQLVAELAELNRQAFLAGRSAASGGPPAATLRSRLEEKRRELLALRTDRANADPQSALHSAALPELDLVALSAELAAARAVALELTVLEDRTLLFLIEPRPGAAAAVRMLTVPISKTDLVARVEAFRRRIAARDLDFEAEARGLHDLILGEAAPALAGAERLCIVPDGVLWSLPFEALAPAVGSFLVERHALVMAPSLAVLQALLRRSASGRGGESGSGRLLAFGNPTWSPEAGEVASSRGAREALAALPDAESEARRIGELYAAEGHVYLRHEASESRFKSEAAGYPVLHVATHGVVDDRSPLFSCVVMAPSVGSPEVGGRTEDGLLEAWEIADLRLDADLVVLSACSTAEGRLSEGEGMIGLTWAFFVAGGRAVVASRWEVDSRATAELMVAFHRRLREGSAKADALREAALALARDERYRHPYYWASFALVGEGFSPIPR